MIAQARRVSAQQQLLAALQIANALRRMQVDVDQTINGFVVLRESGNAFFEIFDARLVDRLELGFAERRVGALNI